METTAKIVIKSNFRWKQMVQDMVRIDNNTVEKFNVRNIKQMLNCWQIWTTKIDLSAFLMKASNRPNSATNKNPRHAGEKYVNFDTNVAWKIL